MGQNDNGRPKSTASERREVQALAVFIVLLFPLVLMAFMLIMERIEEPLTRVAVERDVEDFLDHANPDELDAFIREGTDSALDRFRRRLRLLPGAGRRDRT